MQPRPAFTQQPRRLRRHGSRTVTITVPLTHQAYTDTSDLKNEDFGSHPAIRRTRRLARTLPGLWVSHADGFQAAERATRTSPAPPGRSLAHPSPSRVRAEPDREPTSHPKYLPNSSLSRPPAATQERITRLRLPCNFVDIEYFRTTHLCACN